MKKHLRLLTAVTALFTVAAKAQVPQVALHTPAKAAANRDSKPAARAAASADFVLLTVLKQQFRSIGTAAPAWLDTLRFSYSRFTRENRPLRVLRENAPTRGAALRALRQEYLQYNAAGQLTSDSTITYTNGTLNTYPTLVLVNSYNAQGLLEQEVTSVRLNNVLRPSRRSTYTYNAQRQLTRVLDESYFGANWLYDSESLFTYNAQGQQTQEELRLADISGTSFSPFVRILAAYDAAGLRITDTQQNYVDGAYATTFVTTLTYTAGPAPRLSTYNVQRVSNSGNQPYSQGSNTYDANGNLTEELDQLYNSTQQAYVNNVRYVYTYRQALATASATTLSAGLTVAPNPSTGPEAAVHFRLHSPAATAVQIFDLAGRRVAVAQAVENQLAGEHRVPLAGTSLAPGLYVVRLQAGQHQWQVKWDKR